MENRQSKAVRKFFLIAFAIVLVDQISKFIVKLNMELAGEPIYVLGDLFKIYFIENNGAAFGLTVGHLLEGIGVTISDETGKLILSVFSIIAVIVIGFVLVRIAKHRSPLPLFVAFIFGGALGNIIDRTFYGLWFAEINNYEGGLLQGRVVDMFYFDIWKGFLPNWIPFIGGQHYSLWPIFNVADSAISIGIVVILIFQGKFFRMDEKATKALEGKPVSEVSSADSNGEATKSTDAVAANATQEKSGDSEKKEDADKEVEKEVAASEEEDAKPANE